MSSRWERIVSLRGKLRKQAEAMLHLHQRELGDVEAALDAPACSRSSSALDLQKTEAVREILRQREVELQRQVEASAHELRDRAIAAKQVDCLLQHDLADQAKAETKRDQALLETWQRQRRPKRPQ